MFRKIAGSSLSGSILSATTLALLTGVAVSRAETPAVPGKTWVDPGAIERSKTQGASPEQPSTTQGAAGSAGVAKEPVGKEKIDTAAEKEKLKEIIQKSESSGETATAKSVHAAERKIHSSGSEETRAPAARPAYAHKTVRNARKVTAKHRASTHYAHEFLPSRKDGPAPGMAAPEYDPLTGYVQPIQAAF